MISRNALIKRTQVVSRFDGEFSRREFTTGNRDSSNCKRFMSMQHFDGRLLNGQLPIDSPASGTIGPRRSEPFPRVVDAMIDLPVGIGKTSRLWQFADLANTVALEATPSAETKNCFVIDLVSSEARLTVWLKPEKQFFIDRYISVFGEATVDREVVSYQDCDGIEFPAQVLCKSREVGQSIDVRTQLKVKAINKLGNDLEVKFPEGLPYFDEETGKYGIWGNGAPTRVFRSNEEAIAWSSDEKRMQSARRSRNAIANYQLWGALLFLTFVVALILYRLRRR